MAAFRRGKEKLKKVYAFLQKLVSIIVIFEKIEEVEELEKRKVKINDELAASYERIYFDSLDTREKLGFRAQVPMAILISLGGAQSFMVLAVEPVDESWFFCFFVFSLMLSFLFIVRSFQYFLKVMSGQSYRYIPTLIQIEKYRGDVINSYKDEEGAEEWLTDWVNMAVKEEVLLQMAHCASHNVLRNDLRSRYSSKGHFFLACSVCFTFFSFLFFYFRNLKENPVHKVQLVNKSEFKQKIKYNLVEEALYKKKDYFYKNSDFRNLHD